LWPARTVARYACEWRTVGSVPDSEHLNVGVGVASPGPCGTGVQLIMRHSQVRGGWVSGIYLKSHISFSV